MEIVNAEHESNAEENDVLPQGIEITTYPPTGNLPEWAKPCSGDTPGTGNATSRITENSENAYIPLKPVVEHLIEAKTGVRERKISDWLKAAERGDASAQNNLGVCYSEGNGAPQDYEKAAHWFTKAAEQGNAQAQKNLGLCYFDGDGVPQDYGKAVHWFAEAEKQGKDTPLEEAKRHLEAERNGYIKLAVPIVHRKFFKNNPCIIGDLLGISAQDLEKVIYYEQYIVINPGNSQFKSNQIISEEEYESIKDKANLIGKGAEAVRKALIGIVSPHELGEMILVVLPIIRPATTDLREICRKVVNLNHRVKRLIEAHAPDIVMRNEKRALQEAVDEILEILDSSKTGYSNAT